VTVLRISGRDLNVPDGLAGLFVNEASVRDRFWRPGPGDVVFDIGCYKGSYAIPALIAGATVYAVDPFSEYTAQVAALCRDNGLDTSRLITVNEALAGPGGYPEALWAALAREQWQDIYAHREDTFTTLDDLVTRLGVIRLDRIKIDVEGAELEVLRGGTGVLRRFRPELLIEDHTGIYAFAAEMEISRGCRELLDGLGYRIETVRYADERSPSGSLDRDFWVCRP
jgi:FkbM family methyltransferase